jgi:hypothetical protein
MATVALATLVGCGPSAAWLNARSPTEDVLEDHAQEAAQPTGRPIAVRLNVQAAGCAMAIQPGGDVVACAPVMAASDDAVADLIDHGPASGVGIVFKDFPGAVAAALKWHLGRLFSSVTVAPGGGASPDAVTVSGAITFTVLPGDMRHADVALVAKLPDGTEAMGHGIGEDHMSAGHLGWAIPILVLFFPISLTFVPPSLGAVSDGKSEHAIGLAVDAAAQDLASKLARGDVHPPTTPPATGPAPSATPTAPTAPTTPTTAAAQPPAAGGCAANADCKGGRTCRAGHCEAAPEAATPPAAPPAGQCTKDTDCKGERICNAGRCEAPKR